MNAPILRTETDLDNVRKSMSHLQRCLSALEKIRGIDQSGPIAAIAQKAIENKPWNEHA